MTQAYKIKPLVWEKTREGCKSHTVLGRIFVGQSEDGPYWFTESDDILSGVWEWCDSIEAGKAAGESWYMDQILSALELDT